MSVSDRDRKLLRDRAGGECSFRGCHERQGLEEAHIRGRKPGAARYDADFPQEKLDTYENLVILCSVHHHGVIDDIVEWKNWSVEQLIEMKVSHEKDVEERLRGDVSEFTGNVDVTGSDVDEMTGVKARKPTRFRSGTHIGVTGRNVRRITGLDIGGPDG